MTHISTADKVLQALEAYDVKSTGTNKYCSNSPLRTDSDSHAFNVIIESAEHGAYHDHVSNDAGSLYELAKILGIDPPAGGRVVVADTKRGYRDLEDYAQAHGVAGAVFAEAKWEATTQEGRPALKFPTQGGVRYRFLDGDKPAYKSVTGYKSCWYGLEKAARKAQLAAGAMILCNGEATTVVAQHFGLPACAQTSGEKKLADDLLTTLVETCKAHGISTLWLCYDCDDTGQRVAREVKAQLLGVGLKSVIVDLGLSDAGDLADFCRLYTDKAAAELAARAGIEKPKAEPKPEITPGELALLNQTLGGLKTAIGTDERMRDGIEMARLIAVAQAEIDRLNSSYSKPKVKSFADIADENAKRLEAAQANPESVGLTTGLRAVDSMIGVLRPGLYVFLGATSMGKSTLAVSLTPALVGQKRGLIMSTESATFRWFDKLVARMSGIAADRIENGRLTPEENDRVQSYYAMLGEFECDMLDSGSPTVSMLRAQLLSKEYGWVVIDSISKMEAPGMNDIYSTTRAVLNGVQELAQALEIPIIATSQVGRDVSGRGEKKKQPRLDDAYGGSIIEHNADVVIGVYNHDYYVSKGLEFADEHDYPSGTVTLNLLKHRWSPGSSRYDARVNYTPGVGYFDRTETTVDVTATGKKGSVVYAPDRKF